MSKLTEAETKEIEQLAMEYVSITRPSSFPNGRQEGYIAGATAMAEKKNVDIAYQEDLLIKSGTALSVVTDQLEATQEELKKANERVSRLIDGADKIGGENSHLLLRVSYLKVELEQVKEVAEKMAEVLKGHLWNNGAKEALTEFANLMNKEK